MQTASGLLPYFLVGIVFHALFAISVVDIYFRSPLVHGMDPQPMPAAPAQRLFLIVADGLRADTFFSTEPTQLDGGVSAPFLQSICTKHIGTCGVSHAHVPTETRPGHVALAAGIFEDVSAVTKGWQANPVAFDSVFNRSAHAVGWGSPDVVPMFQIESHCYSAESEDFAGDTRALDAWVFDAVEAELREALHNESVRARWAQPQSIYFLHLLALDTIGHAYRPHALEYAAGLRFVDDGVRRLVEWVHRVFPADDSVFVFTADHGMSARGSHGDGDPANTRTPLVVWGAGAEARGPHHDVRQVDLAPLMAALLGVPIPVHSVGRLPLDYVGGSAERRGRAALSNVAQVAAQYVRHLQLRQQHALWFRPYGPLPDAAAVDAWLAGPRALLEQARYEEAAAAALARTDTLLAGLRYLCTYDRPALLAVDALAYLGWMAAVLAALDGAPPPQWRSPRTTLAVALLGAVWAVLAAERAPPQYFAYTAMAAATWRWALGETPVRRLLQAAMRPGAARPWLLAAVVLELLVAAYFHRGLLSVGAAALALLAPALGVRGRVRYAWAAACLALAVFPLLPVEGLESAALVCCGAAVLAAAAVVVLWRVGVAPRAGRGSQLLLGVQIALVALAAVVVAHTTAQLQARLPLPPVNRLVSYGILVSSWPLPLLSPPDPVLRSVSVVLGLAAPYVLLSTSYEVLFLACLVAALALWPALQQAAGAQTSAGETAAALLLLFFVKIAFFGTGNIASISSFDIASTYRFETVFSPFLMGALLLLKVLIPFVAVSFASNLATRVVHGSPARLLLRAAALGDVLALNFLFLVRDEGSWLEIGMSISHFGIQNGMTIALLLVFGLAAVYARGVQVASVKRTSSW